MANTTTIQQSGINFTVDNRVSQYQGWGKKYANSNNKGDVYPADPSNMAFGINAVEIDWNSAQVNINGETTTINTSGELLKVIENISNQEIHNYNGNIGDFYTKDEVDDKFQEKGSYLTKHQDLSEYAKIVDIEEIYQPKGEYLTKHQSLEGYATEEYVDQKVYNLGIGNFYTKNETNNLIDEKITNVLEVAPEALETLNELANQLNNNDDAVSTLTAQIATKANIGDSYTKTESDNNYQPKGNYLTEHQSLEGYAIEEYVDQKVYDFGVGNFYTKNEIDNAGFLTEHQDLSEYAKTLDIEKTYQQKGTYLTEHQSLEGYATEEYVDQKVYDLGIGYFYTKSEIDNAGFLTEYQDLSEYAKTSDIEAAYQPKGTYLTEHQDLSEYAKTTDIEAAYQQKGTYLTEHQSLEGYATEEYVGQKVYDLGIGYFYTKTEANDKFQEKGTYLTEHQDLSEYAKTSDIEAAYQQKGTYLTEHQSLEGYATEEYVGQKVYDLGIGYFYTKSEIDNAGFLTEYQDLSEYAKTADIESTYQQKGTYLTEHQDISGKANVGDSYTKTESDNRYIKEHQSLEGYASEEYVDQKVYDLGIGYFYTKSEIDEMIAQLRQLINQ